MSVCDRNWKSEQARGRSPLDHVPLYTARFDEAGTGEWLWQVQGEGPLTPPTVSQTMATL